MKCGECGASITAEEKTKKQKNGNVHHYTYYRCTKRKVPNCTQKTIRKKELEKQIKKILGTISIPPEFHDWAMEVLKKENKQESQDRNTILSAQQKAYNACIKKIDVLIDMRANSEITEQEFKNKKTQALKEKSRLQELLKDTDHRVDNWLCRAENFFDFARDAKNKFDNGSLETKKQILACLGSNLLLKDRKLAIELEKPLIPIQQALCEVKKIHNRLEPAEYGLDKSKIGLLYARNCVLGG